MPTIHTTSKRQAEGAAPTSLKHERNQLLDLELERCVDLLIRHGPPEKIILFGSMARNSISEWSDIDLVVIEETDLPFFKRIKQHRSLLMPRVGMDITVYTPEEFSRMAKESLFVQEEIVKKGRVLYER